MKKLLTVCFFLAAFGLHAQQDSTRRIAISGGAAAGGGYILTESSLPAFYGALMHENRWYAAGSFYAMVLFRERIGFRISGGTLGRMSATENYDYYTAQAYPDYHVLPEYSTLQCGYIYDYFAPHFVYRLGDEPFNLTLSLGAGVGKLKLPEGDAILQKDGSNDFKVVTYTAPSVRNVYAEFNAEMGYMRQLSQHWFANTGVFVNIVCVKSNYDFYVTETPYGQASQNTVSAHSDDLLLHLNVGIFLNLQWNKRESPRAYYE